MRAEATAPCTVGNFGPGFDVFSLALDLRGDRVVLEASDRDEVRVTGPGANSIPRDWAKNSACAAIDALRRASGKDARLLVTIDKGVRPGSGLGSSASSSAAAILAFARMHGLALAGDVALDAAGMGEAVATGAAHYDDVAAALYGGLVIVGGPGPDRVLRLTPPRGLTLAIILPQQQLDTRDMRARIPAAIPRGDVVKNLSSVARVVHACHTDDAALLARALDDHISKPYRKGAIDKFSATEDAARRAGASAFVLCGSGPAMLAVIPPGVDARAVLDAAASQHPAGTVETFVTRPAQVVNDPALPLS